MRDLRWIDRAGPTESLASALQSLLATRGNDASYEQLVAALGLGTLAIFGRDRPEALGEPARDTQLIAAADALGLRLRELHPISAAQRLESSDEFRQHFIDSYAPLILRAFEVGQVALAWNGWPGPDRGRWGVLLPGVGGEMRGISSGLRATETYVGPAHQVYIVEEIVTAPVPDATSTFGLVTTAFRAQQAGNWSADESNLTGRAALEALRDALKSDASASLRSELVALRERRRALLGWLTPAVETGKLGHPAALAWRDTIRANVERLEVVSVPAIGGRDLAAVVGEIIRADNVLLESAGACAATEHDSPGVRPGAAQLGSER